MSCALKKCTSVPRVLTEYPFLPCFSRTLFNGHPCNASQDAGRDFFALSTHELLLHLMVGINSSIARSRSHRCGVILAAVCSVYTHGTLSPYQQTHTYMMTCVHVEAMCVRPISFQEPIAHRRCFGLQFVHRSFAYGGRQQHHLLLLLREPSLCCSESARTHVFPIVYSPLRVSILVNSWILLEGF